MEPWKPSIGAVNYHIWRTCNMKCRFCYATYDSILPARARRGIPLPGVRELIGLLAAAGFAKITFAGGEPTLCPWLAASAAYAKDQGLVTGVVTNGSRLTPALVESLAPHLDWLTLSIDSASPAVNARTGRAVAGRRPVDVSVLAGVAGEFRRRGARLKVNTVVTRHNCGERLLGVIGAIAPDRWKVMRALRIEGENDRDFGDLDVTDRQFARFLAVNRDVPDGTVRVCEDNEDMIASYVMVDPAGRFVDNSSGRYRVSAPIASAGVEAAYRQVTHDPDAFRRRGGRYDW